MSTKTIRGRSSTSSAQSHNGTFYFPKELIAEIILPRLPVKSLLRFRCVSKPWCSNYIDDSRFVKKYLERNIECNRDRAIILRDRDNKFFLADVDSLDDSTVTKIADPVKSQISGAELVGSCNGLVCLWKRYKKDAIILWNPATNKCRKLPEPTIPNFRLVGSSVAGFGYDHLTDDYKVVRTSRSQLIIYSLKNNSWTRAETNMDEISLMGTNGGKFVNGALHWLGRGDMIVAFDLGVFQRHRNMPFPGDMEKNINRYTYCLELMVFDGCLSIVVYCNGRIDVWVKNNYWEEKIWTKLLSVVNQSKKIMRPFEFVCPLAFSKTRKDVLLEVNQQKYMWYNVERNEFKNVKVHGMPVAFESRVYTQSLVQVANDSNFQIRGEEDEQEQKQE